MPSEAWGNPAWFLCENHKILKIDHLEDHYYTLYHTTEQLCPIGLAEGRAVYLDDGLLATIVYQGFYKAYSYTDTSVTEITSLPFPSGQQRFTVIGDTLWFTTHEDWVYAYDIEDPTKPQLLLQILVPGYHGPFIVKGDLLVTGNHTGETDTQHTILFSRFDVNGNALRVASLGGIHLIRDMKLIDSYIIILGHRQDQGMRVFVVDIQNVSNPQIVSEFPKSQYSIYRSHFVGSYTVLIPKRHSDDDPIFYEIMDYSDPLSPTSIGPIDIGLDIYRAIRPDLIVAYTTDGMGPMVGYTAIMRGDIQSGGFQQVALAKANSDWTEGGYNPPYYLIGGRLWKLGSWE